MKRFTFYFLMLFVVFGIIGQAEAAIMLWSGPPSSRGVDPAIIPAPENALNSEAFNSGMEGFDEAQGVLTTAAYATDSGVIPAGTLVNSHMIFLNAEDGTAAMSHVDVTWIFDGPIVGVMSDSNGNLEAASTSELGAPGTNYTVGPPGQVAPYPARGMEGGDSYTFGGNTITVNMGVSQPGDWIRVITEVIEVSIDIKPGSDPNAINLKSKGVIPVAILGSATFDAATVDITSLSFGPAGAAPVHDLTDPDVLAEHLQDVNGDGYVDLVSHYNVQETGIAAGDAKACLTGLTAYNQAIKGCDAIVTVPKAAPSQGSRGSSATWGNIKSR
jgi:hypothetical protein